MTSHLKTYPDALRQLFVAATATETNEVFDLAVAQIQKSFSLPGYRKGKVPADIIAKTNPPELMDLVSDIFMRKALGEIDTPFYGQPRFNPLSGLSRDKEFNFSLVFEVYPSITKAPDLNTEINFKECVVDTAFVEEALCRQIGLTETSSDKIKEGDLVQVSVTNADYSGDKKDAAFDSSKLTALVGKKVGDSVTLAFDELSGYLPEFLGKVSDPLTVTISEVSRAKSWATVTDEEIAAKTPFKTKDEYKQITEGQLNDIANSYNDSQKAIALTSVIGAQIDVELPKSLWLNNIQDLAVRTAEQDVVRQDIALNNIENNKEVMDKFTNLPVEARNGLAFILWVDDVAKTENISVEDGELEYHYHRYAQNQRMSIADFKKRLRPEDTANIRLEIIREKAIRHIISKAKFKASETISIAEVIKQGQ